MNAWVPLAAMLFLSAAAAPPELIYAGSYGCVQGQTRLVLTVRPGDGGTAEALFRFGPLPSNPRVPEGCFAMSGTFHAGHVRLLPGAWLSRPSGYVAVGLDGTLSEDGRTVIGTVDGPGCSGFSVTQVKRDPGAAACTAPTS